MIDHRYVESPLWKTIDDDEVRKEQLKYELKSEFLFFIVFRDIWSLDGVWKFENFFESHLRRIIFNKIFVMNQWGRCIVTFHLFICKNINLLELQRFAKHFCRSCSESFCCLLEGNIFRRVELFSWAIRIALTSS